MGVYSIKLFNDPNNPSPGDGVLYYYLTSSELQQLSAIYPDLARDFFMTHEDYPDYYFAHPNNIDSTEWGELNDFNMVHRMGFELSNQPSGWGG